MSSLRDTRRIRSPEQKRAILAEADDPGTTASEVHRRHGLHSSLLFPMAARLAGRAAGLGCPTDLHPARPAAPAPGDHRGAG
ncbi:transposase [Methylobacterium aquaticum]|uniref:transposase n=1 Tax=Methylobacterium aquaticum TaxID=270351 RepID=UPI0019314454|nr:transposase [Methylobacterium aquaticum]